MTPDDVIEMVKASGLRGRGGAGFPTGMKWQFVDKKSPKPRYIACNADESEPGTFKDHLLMERNPHLLIEGCAIGCYAIGAKVAYIYIRGEFFHVQQCSSARSTRPTRTGFLGKNILGSGFDCDVYVHRGAGAYEAGEETALLESLEGKRAQPRNKPPFPAVVGLYGCPTAVNNVETLCNVPLDRRATAPSGSPALGPEKNGGPKLYCVSGHVKRPGVYEASMNITLRELIDGLRRRRARRPDAQGGHSRRLVGADPAARSARHAGQLRRRAEGRLAARVGRRSSCSTTRPAWCGWPRTCCTSTATSRAASARRAARAPTGCTRSCSGSSAAKGRCATSICSRASRQHRRQDAVRVRRRRGRRRC